MAHARIYFEITTGSRPHGVAAKNRRENSDPT